VRKERRSLHLRSGSQHGPGNSGVHQDRCGVRPTRDSQPGCVRDYVATRYAAKSWPHACRVVAWIEATRKGLDVRYVVTNVTHGTPGWLYDDLYCARGQAENLIKRDKSQLASDRTSCRAPLANQMRLILHTAAYWLMRRLRDSILKPQPLASGEFSTIRLRLLKIAVRIKETASRVRLAFAANCPDAELFRDLVGADPAPDVRGGADAPSKPLLINPWRMTDMD
jgi:hypothetical protein